MKTPAFWYEPRGGLACALSPLSFIWRAGGAVRRALAVPYRSPVPVICVGNITAGGSGKTPTALALGQMLKENGQKPVFVTRGYGGRERGPLRVDLAYHTAQDVGDEALLLAQVAPTWIGRDRAAAVRAAEAHGTHILLDDGLQNPSIQPSHSLLVIDAAVGLGNECIIPAGPLRETLDAALKRVTAIVLVGERDETNLMPRLTKPILHARLQAMLPENFPRSEKFLAFAGIGRPEKFYQACRQAGLTLVGTWDFPDHHTFSAREMESLKSAAKDLGARLLTTEKDAVRLLPELRSHVSTLPIQLVFGDPIAIKKLITAAA
ncbi:MAG: tetraacyldisaccharide 4'-kinase [Alphaproteobacteria bacterium]|nr:tetraacyldisaccharide 4'-kinase [Alphaproteobacteria bacterium]